MRRRVFGNTPPPIPSNISYVDMGMDVLWSTCNLGASQPWEYGLYYAWGDTKGYENGSEKPSGGFSYSNAPYFKSGSSAATAKYSKYVLSSSYGTVDNKTTLELEDDAAYNAFKNVRVRMPTREEFNELLDICNTSDYSWNDTSGRLFTLKTNDSKQLFFPKAGYCTDYGNPTSKNVMCDYWTSTLYNGEGYNAYEYKYYMFTGESANKGCYRFYGLPIRPVIEK